MRRTLGRSIPGVSNNTATYVRPFALLLVIIAGPYARPIEAQTQSTPPTGVSVSGTASITNNGFSFIPAFTLDRPAGLLYLTVAKNGFSVSTDVRYSLEGRPWTMSFVSRQTLIDRPKGQVSVGLYYPSLSFVKASSTRDNPDPDTIEVEQSVSPEVSASLRPRKGLALGSTYMGYRGIGPGSVRSGHFQSIWAALEGIRVVKDVRLSVNGQAFYLSLDRDSGYYTAWNVVLSEGAWPFTVSSMSYWKLQSEIGGADSRWNLSLNYRFSGRYVK